MRSQIPLHTALRHVEQKDQPPVSHDLPNYRACYNYFACEVY
jgi:hypothetical protein